MKKLPGILLAVVCCCAVICAVAEEPVEYKSKETGCTYVLLEDGTAKITGWSGGKNEALTVPETVDGVTVTALDHWTFYWADSVTVIELPNTLTTITGNPFARIPKLKTIRVAPDHPTLATIDGVLFSKTDKRVICYPTGLDATEYAIPQGIRSIGKGAFYGAKFRKLTIPDTVTDIGEGAFGSSRIRLIEIPDSVTSLGANAFDTCIYLEQVVLPEGLTHIGDYAFIRCLELESISLPDSVTTIGSNPFSECPKLQKVSVSPDHPVLAVVNDALIGREDGRLIAYPCGSFMRQYSVPQGVRSIGASAFAGNETLRSITLPDSVTAIGTLAFSNCTALTSVTLPEGLTTIGGSAFWICSSLTGVVIPEGVTTIEDYTFWECSRLTDVTLPDTLTVIGKKAFEKCGWLTSLTLPASVTAIGEEAFDECSRLTLTVPYESYAQRYAEANNIPYAYADSTDWLLN